MSERKTEFSPCRRYRYVLWRELPPEFSMATASTDPDAIYHGHEYLMVIGLNPSTADETQDDPTIRKCIGFAKRWGFGALCMTNLFSWRDTKPENMKRAAEPVGMDNHHHIVKCASAAGLVLAAWGKDGSFHHQDLNMQQWLSSINIPIQCLRRNKDGSPMHPLYVPYETQPIPYAP